MQKIKLAKNTAASLLSQITAIICGFILPRLILQSYGSDVNGLVNSIAQFLRIISFLELGVGAVIQSSLYKPLAEHDEHKVSEIIKSGNEFFRHLALLLLIYVLLIVGVYPLLVNRNFGYLYTATLIAAMSISSFAQYYFGIVNSLLLNADQRGYIQYNAQTITVLANTMVCAVLVSQGHSIQLVKLTTSLIYLARPVVMQLYVNKKYRIDSKTVCKEEPIKQKWNGVAQHIAATVLDNTDTVVLTAFSTLANVSIYSVYYLVISGVKRLFLASTNGIQAMLGELWAKQEKDQLWSTFSWVEWAIHTGTTYVFGCTAALIVAFVRVYTKGVSDANYIQPTFALVLTLAHTMHCLRLPYNIMVLAAGHYRQTQRNYIVAAVLNITVSVLVVYYWGLVGVAAGTLVAMAYQTLWLAKYNSQNLIRWPLKNVIKQFLTDAVTAGAIIGIGTLMKMKAVSYAGWAILAIQVALMALVIVILINIVFYREKTTWLFKKLKKKVGR